MDLLSRVVAWLSDHEAAISAVAAIIVIGGVVLTGLRLLVRRPGKDSTETAASGSAEPASALEASAPDLDPLTVPGFEGRPAIAVLPFDNLSGDPDQEYFADGIAEDLITRLSAWRDFPVRARNSSFTYKGKAVDVKEVSRELGVRYVAVVLSDFTAKLLWRSQQALEPAIGPGGHAIDDGWCGHHQHRLDRTGTIGQQRRRLSGALEERLHQCLD